MMFVTLNLNCMFCAFAIQWQLGRTDHRQIDGAARADTRIPPNPKLPLVVRARSKISYRICSGFFGKDYVVPFTVKLIATNTDFL